MDKIGLYREHIKRLLNEYSRNKPSYGEVETEVIVDVEHDHYQLVHVGWDNKRRVYGCVLHFDIKRDKVWIQYNGTECHVAEELVELGVSKEDIVLGFHSPYQRKFTEYAVD